METIFITGASSGIGRATARLFQQRGWNVAATARDPASIADLAALPNVKAYRLDVTDQASVDAAIAAAEADFGQIDVLLNNAGFGAVGPFEAAGDAAVRAQFETNVFGLMRVTRAVLPAMRRRRSGTIVNISSVGGQITFPLYSLYHASKWAVDGFTESLQFELRPFGIKLRLIEPGAIKTDFYGRSQSVAAQPGLDAYDSYVERVFPAEQAFGASAPGPELVARRVWKAVRHRGWKLRWLVGKEGAFVMLKRIIPNSWFFALVRAALKA